MRTAKMNQQFFMKLLDKEYSRGEPNPPFRTLNQIINKLVNVNGTPLIWKKIISKEDGQFFK